MWIFCGGMQRSASTLQFQIASELVEKNTVGKRITWYNPEEHAEIISAYQDINYYKVFKAHIVTDSIFQQFMDNNAVGVYIYRDLRDVVSSLQEKNKTVYEDQILCKLINNLINQHQRWISMKPVHISKYENVINNINDEIITIARFIGLINNCMDIDKLSKKLSLMEQKKSIESMQIKDNLIFVNNLNVYDPETLLHMNHISSGRIGRYKEDLTQKQIATIEREASIWLLNNGY